MLNVMTMQSEQVGNFLSISNNDYTGRRLNNGEGRELVIPSTAEYEMDYAVKIGRPGSIKTGENLDWWKVLAYDDGYVDDSNGILTVVLDPVRWCFSVGPPVGWVANEVARRMNVSANVSRASGPPSRTSPGRRLGAQLGVEEGNSQAVGGLMPRLTIRTESAFWRGREVTTATFEDVCPTCRYWDTQANRWSTRGCRVTGMDPATLRVTCSCNHLTDFGATFETVGRQVCPFATNQIQRVNFRIGNHKILLDCVVAVTIYALSRTPGRLPC